MEWGWKNQEWFYHYQSAVWPRNSLLQIAVPILRWHVTRFWTQFNQCVFWGRFPHSTKEQLSHISWVSSSTTQFWHFSPRGEPRREAAEGTSPRHMIPDSSPELWGKSDCCGKPICVQSVQTSVLACHCPWAPPDLGTARPQKNVYCLLQGSGSQNFILKESLCGIREKAETNASCLRCSGRVLRAMWVVRTTETWTTCAQLSDWLALRRTLQASSTTWFQQGWGPCACPWQFSAAIGWGFASCRIAWEYLSGLLSVSF